MMPKAAEDALAELSQLVAESKAITVFTGAGLSTESGIPDYRSPGGIWSQMEPITYQQFVASDEARLEDWRRRFVMNTDFRRAEPNEGYRALDALHACGKLHGIITQNIDGLHLRGSVPPDKVIELHGNATYGRCLDCAQSMALEQVRIAIRQTGTGPRCSNCGGLVKAAVISFGQQLDADALELAAHWSVAADLFLVLGSSLVVEPAASLPRRAVARGAQLAIINREPTPLDALARCVIHDGLGTSLQSVVHTDDATSR